MTEYQYYEFLAVEQPLSERAMRELRSISSCAEITPTHFSNEYSYGDLRADPAKLLERYFDVHVYLANWGSRRLALRFPRDALSLQEVESYCVGGGAVARRTRRYLIIDLWSEWEGGDGWVEVRGWAASLGAVRSELLQGDLRPLYLGWLLRVDMEQVDDDDLEPPVPPGLESLTASLQTLTEFLRIDEFLIAAAAEASPPEAPVLAALGEWIAGLAPNEKDSWLHRAVQGEHAQVAAELLRRFRAEVRTTGGNSEQPQRTAGELRNRANALRKEHDRKQARKDARARLRREKVALAARAKHLDALAARGSQAWEDVERLVASRKPKSYDEAARLLVDLRDLAARDGDEQDFNSRMDAVRERHSRKPTLIARLDRMGLPTP